MEEDYNKKLEELEKEIIEIVSDRKDGSEFLVNYEIETIKRNFVFDIVSKVIMFTKIKNSLLKNEYHDVL